MPLTAVFFLEIDEENTFMGYIPYESSGRRYSDRGCAACRKTAQKNAMHSFMLQELFTNWLFIAKIYYS